MAGQEKNVGAAVGAGNGGGTTPTARGASESAQSQRSRKHDLVSGVVWIVREEKEAEKRVREARVLEAAAFVWSRRGFLFVWREGEGGARRCVVALPKWTQKGGQSVTPKHRKEKRRQSEHEIGTRKKRNRKTG